MVKSKCISNRIEIVRDATNLLDEGDQVPSDLVSHYTQFLGQVGATNDLDDNDDLFLHTLESAKALYMTREITDDEIKSAIFSIGDDKAPGPDGYTAAFFCFFGKGIQRPGKIYTKKTDKYKGMCQMYHINLKPMLEQPSTNV